MISKGAGTTIFSGLKGFFSKSEAKKTNAERIKKTDFLSYDWDIYPNIIYVS